MKYNKLLVVAVVLIICATPAELFATIKNVMLKDALAKKLVSIIGIGNGGARGKCLTLELTNRTKEPMMVTVDPAMIFVPSDTSYQNLVAAGSEMITLQPHGCGELTLETFCGKSYASSPRTGLKYSFWKQGDVSMVKTMDFIRRKGYLDNLGQCAVWTFTNAKSLSTVYSAHSPEEQMRSKILVEYIARERHLPIPKYFSTYKLDHTPGSSMIVANSLQHYVEMEWLNGTGYGNMHVRVYTEDGNFYKQINGNDECGPTGHRVTVNFDPKVDLGNFYVVLKDDYGNIWDRKDITVGID